MKENNALLRLDGVGFKTDDAVIFTQYQFSASRRRIQVDYRPFRLREKYLAEDYRLAAQPNLRAPILRRMRMSRRCRRKGYRQQVSYCAQTPALFGDSVYDNLIFSVADPQ